MNRELSIEILEYAQDSAVQTIAGKLATFPPALAAGATEDEERGFLREYFAVLDDLLVAGATLELLEHHRGHADTQLAFTINQGSLRFPRGLLPNARPLPAFRSAADEIGGAYAGTILYSDIVPLGQSYAIFELRGDTTNLRLHIVGGGKNDGEIYISLYTNGRLIEKSLLGLEVSWDLSDCAAGRYQLHCNDRPTLSFQIQE